MTKSKKDQKKQDDSKEEANTSDVTGATSEPTDAKERPDDEGESPSEEEIAASGGSRGAGLPDPSGDEPLSADAGDAPVADDATQTDTPKPDDRPAGESLPDDPLVPPLAEALATAPLVATGTEVSRRAANPAPSAPGSDGTHENTNDHDHDEHDEEEARRSFASRVLTWLILLLVGGGIALWGGPKVAPHLPNGLGPVKSWLMPGALETEARIAALEDSVAARFAALDTGVSADEVSATVDERLGAARQEIDASLQSLGDKVEAADSAAIEGRLAQLEARVKGLTSQLESLSGLAADGAGLNEEQLAQISTFAAAVDGLRAEVATLAEAQGGLSQRIDDVEVTVERKLAEAEEEIVAVRTEAEVVKSTAVARAALTAIEAAVSSGEPFEASLAELSANTDAAVPDALGTVAAAGVSPLGQLRESFPDAAHAAIRADVRARESGSVGGRLAAFIEAQVATRSLTPREGESTDAILSRAEDALRHDNLAAAVEELTALSDAPKEAMSGWISRATDRVAATSAIAELSAVLAAEN